MSGPVNFTNVVIAFGDAYAGVIRSPGFESGVIGVVGAAGAAVSYLPQVATWVPVTSVLLNAASAGIVGGKIIGDWIEGKPISPGDVITVAGNAVGVVIAASVSAGFAVPAIVGVGAAAVITVAAAAANARDAQAGQGGDPAAQQFFDSLNDLIDSLQDAMDWLQDPIGFNDFFTDPARVDDGVHSSYQNGVSWRSRDPLALDLDGDGIDVLSGEHTVLFDHNSDGIRTGTGWLASDDAWLVLDRDGNGTIDSGAELFGVDTRLANGNYARTGFEALGDVDSNNDRLIDANDAAFAQLRLWRDLNSDGVSQANELFTLPQQNVESISLMWKGVNQDLGGGNSVSATAVVNRVDHTTTGVSGVVVGHDSAGNLNLADNPFYREFPAIPVSEAAAALPDMRGSGLVRDLREAMSLDTWQSRRLAATVAEFVGATTREQQTALMGKLLRHWAATSGETQNWGGPLYKFKEELPGAGGSLSAGGWQGGEAPPPPREPIVLRADKVGNAGIVARIATFAEDLDWSLPEWRSLLEQADFVASNEAAISILEHLKTIGLAVSHGVDSGGCWFMQDAMPNLASYEKFGTLSIFNGQDHRLLARDFENSTQPMNIGFFLHPTNRRFFDLSFDALVDSVYGSLAIQTRLRPYLDAIELEFTESGLVFSADPVAELLESKKASNPVEAFEDLIDLNRYGASTLQAVGFGGLDLLRSWIDALPPESPIRAELVELGLLASSVQVGSDKGDLYFGDASFNQFNGGEGIDLADGGAGPDILYGGNGDDVLQGGLDDDRLSGDAGNDLLVGGAGNDGAYGAAGSDTLIGGEGHDTLEGGLGDDTIEGGAGNDDITSGEGSDVVRFGRGDGQDMIRGSYDDFGAKVDVIELKPGISPADVILQTSGGVLIIKIAGTSDQLSVADFLHQESLSNPYNPMQELRFADGTVWTPAEILARVLAGTAGDDVASGTLADEVITGLAGNDNLNGRGGNDTVEGGTGNDTLNGEGGADTLRGGDGDDYMLSGTGDDLLEGEAGNDRLYGSDGSDTLIGAEGSDTLEGGDGSDTIEGGAGNDDITAGLGSDLIRFGRGDGQDIVRGTTDAAAGKVDVIELREGIAPSDVILHTSGTLLTIKIAGTSDQLAIVGFLHEESTSNLYSPLQQLKFADGTIWTAADIMARVLGGSEGADSAIGTTASEFIAGLGGNDTLSGRGGNDTLDGGAGDDWLNGDEGDDRLIGADGDDDFSGGAGNDLIDAGSGDDYLYDSVGNNTLLAGSGNDTIVAGAGNDTIDAGAGNDDITPGAGSDLILFGRGDGQDMVRSSNDAAAGKIDVLRLRDGIAPADLILSASYGSLVIKIAGTSDQISFNDFLYQDSPLNAWNSLQRIEFANGLVWGIPEIMAKLYGASELADAIQGSPNADYFSGLGGNDTLSGRGGNDTLDGGAGNDNLTGDDGDDVVLGGADTDNLYGGAGSDLLDAGTGNDRAYGDDGNDMIVGGDGHDTLEGGVGNDTIDGGTGNDDITAGLGSDLIRFGRGDGQDMVRSTNDATAGKLDVLELRAGISPADVILHTSGNVLIIKIAGTSDQISFNDFGWQESTSNSWNSLQQIKFADGTIWTPADIMTRVLAGTEGADSATGMSGSELITGLGGNDTLNGRGGNDTLDGGAGTDNLSGEVGDDVLLGGSDGDNLYGGAGNDSLDAGTGNDRAYGDDGNDLVLGGDGHDTLEGGVGNDTIDAGTGNDDITAGLGSDVIRFGRGDGQDVVRSTNDNAAGKLDVLELRAGIAPADVILNTSGSTLILKIAGTGDQISFYDFSWQESTGNAWNPLQQIKFADGTIWTPADIMARVLAGTEGADSATGLLGSELITGLGGNDTLSGRGGNDTLDGGAGIDNLSGDAGDDVLLGGGDGDNLYGGVGNDSLDAGTGNDRANGDDGNDVVLGGEGHDTLEGGTGNDTIDAGAGSDDITGGLGSDVILFGRGDGQDVLRSTNDATAGKQDVIRFKAGISAADVTVAASSSTLVIKIAGTTDQISVYDFLWQDNPANTWNSLQRIEFADGSAWSLSDILGRLMTGNASANAIRGTIGADSMSGLEGNDTLTGLDGADTLDGGLGNDSLIGGAGGDVYRFGRGAGADRLSENDATANVLDWVEFGADVLQGDVSFVRNTNALEVRVAGAVDVLTIENWFLGAQHRVERFKFGDNSVLTDQQVAGLVQAMAAFNAPTVQTLSAVSDESVRRHQGLAVSGLI